MDARRVRRAASPLISVGKLVEVLERWFEMRGTRDVTQLLSQIATGLSWKSRPKAAPLSSISDLLEMLADLAPNGALPPSKLATALRMAHGNKAVNYTGTALEQWADNTGGLIRMAFGKMPLLLEDPQRTRTLTQASRTMTTHARHRKRKTAHKGKTQKRGAQTTRKYFSIYIFIYIYIYTHIHILFVFLFSWVLVGYVCFFRGFWLHFFVGFGRIVAFCVVLSFFFFLIHIQICTHK